MARVIPLLVIFFGVVVAVPAHAEVVAVHLVSRVGPEGVADGQPKRARVDEEVTLFAVLEVEREGRRTYFSDAPCVRLDGRLHTPRPLREAGFALLLWTTIEPAVESLSNTGSGRFRFEPIPYGEVPIAVQTGALRADVRPRLTPDYGDGVGTMRYRLIALTRSGLHATPGPEARRTRGAGGLTDEVHRVSLRRDDSYLGYLTELFGQPYIWASAGTTDRTHQSERLEGSDCADFVVYGWRRLGHAVPYTWSGGLPEHTRLLHAGRADRQGIVRDRHGEPIPFPRPGDLLLFPRHVGVVTVDRGHLGVLDLDDLMMHTLFHSPREQPLGESGYGDRPIEVRRWR